MSEAKAKFDVDADGFRALQEGREPWALAKEPIANSFDEHKVTRVEVTLTPHARGRVLMTIVDDGPGFASFKDAWTLYADTYKRRAAATRGRFNRGEKELLAVATWGKIATTCGTVEFDRYSRREYPRRKTEGGTIVEVVVVPWTLAQMEDTIRRLRDFMPPANIKSYVVNGFEVVRRAPDYRASGVRLETVLDEGDGVLRKVTRTTDIEVHRETPARSALMEMGIPVVSLEDLGVPYLIDVQQKVPMSPERDAVRPSYLQDVLAEVLNVVASDMTEEEANASWINLAIKDPRTTPATVGLVKQKRVGNALILSAANPLAAERAIAAGYGVLSTRGWDPEVVERFREDAGWQSTAQVFPAPTPSTDYEPVDETPGMKRWREFVQQLAAVAFGRSADVEFVRLEGAWAVAECGARSGIVTVYVNRLNRSFFDGETYNQIVLALHEIAHLGDGNGNPYVLHDEKWGERVAKAGATLATTPELLKVLRGEN